MEIGAMILTEVSQKVIITILFKYLGHSFKKWLVKKYPFKKDKLIIDINSLRITNKPSLQNISFMINIRNFNYSNIIIEKVAIELIKDNYTVLNIDKTFTETELQNNYHWYKDLTHANIKGFEPLFVEFNKYKEIFISEGEFRLKLNVFYNYLTKKGSTEYELKRTIEMDCKKE